MTRIPPVFASLLALLPGVLAAQARADTLPDWRRHGVCYEVFVRSFQDSDGDGVGDLRGLIERLDYVNDGDPQTGSDLGARCLWLMPIAQSPSYHGYDVTNYYQVNRDFGTNEDFRELVEAAHARGIRVLVDLVLNHMSSEHPYFKSALLDPASPYRDWFTWSPTVRPSPGWEAPVWHRARDREEYYYGLFWQGMPDIALGNPAATQELRAVTRFWLEEMDVDGFRLDAVGHFFEGPGGQWKNGPAVHPWLRDYAAFIRGIEPDAFTVGEVYDPIDAIIPYYPDQLDSYFMFELADSLIRAVRDGSGGGLVRTVERLQRELPPGRWSPFLSNHDRTRIMTELQGDVSRARLAATLLLTLPGFPFVYYGEELGMSGTKPDPRLRTPMPWAQERGVGFTSAVPWEPLQPDSLTANVAAQDGDATSLLNHYRRLIRLRAAHPALAADGELHALETGDDAVIAWLRRAGGRSALIVANLGATEVTRLTLSSRGAVLAPGRYRVTLLPGESVAGTLRVGRDGRIARWAGVPRLAPRQAVILDLGR